MQRRGVTVLVGAVIVALLTGGVLAAPVPYVVLDPGPTVDTLGEREGGPVIEITGTSSSDSDGQLRLTTVGVDPEVGLPDVVRGWLDSEEAVVPRELIYPPEQTEQEVEQRNQQLFTRSQGAAEAAALRHLGYPSRVAVAAVLDGAPADGLLAEGDIITSVNDTAVDTPSQLQDEVTAHPAGTTLTIGYRRDGETDTVEITTAPDEQDGSTPRIGVAVEVVAEAPFDVTFDLDRIGGPSAGLMFALGIVDKLEPEDLTGGHIIAGTGEIDAGGEVGGVGMVPLKLVAARDAGATAFLVPAANCAEAVRNAQPDLTLIRVETLAGALDELAALRAGEPVTRC